MIHQLDPIFTGAANMCASTLIEKYRQLGHDQPAVQWPSVSKERVSWLSKSRQEQVELIIFHGDDSAPFAGLAYGIQLMDAGLQIVALPVILLESIVDSPFKTSDEYNECLLISVQAIAHSPHLLRAWVEKLHELVGQALGYLINQKTALRPRQRRLDHAIQ